MRVVSFCHSGVGVPKLLGNYRHWDAFHRKAAGVSMAENVKPYLRYYFGDLASLLDRATDCAADLISERFGSGAVSARIQAHVFTAGF